MIVGIGVDLVDIPRFERAVARTPGLVDRLFADAEKGLRTSSLAARYAAKEALIKALGGSDGVHWREIEVARASGAAPRFALSGSTAAVAAARGITALHLSLSHDAGLAVAYVVAEAEAAASAPTAPPVSLATAPSDPSPATRRRTDRPMSELSGRIPPTSVDSSDAEKGAEA